MTAPLSTDSAILLMLAEQRQTIAALQAANAALRKKLAEPHESGQSSAVPNGHEQG